MPQQPSAPAEGPPVNIASQVGAATFSRFLMNTTRRFPYPFAPVLSRGLGVPLTAVTSLIAVNQVTGLLSIFFGPLGDRRGYRVMMLLGVSMLAVGMAAAGFLPFYGVVMLALFLAGLGKSIFDPALQAFVGAYVPYHRRGLAIGLIEMSWSAASLLGIPLVGLLIDSWNWRAPFFAISGLALLGFVIVARVIPASGSSQKTDRVPPGIKAAWRQLRAEPAALGGLGFAFWVSAANDNLFVVYGVWLEKSFGLSVVALGLATTVIGVAELLGEGMTASLADRLGLKRSVLFSLSLSVGAYAVLPLLGGSLPAALGGLFVLFITVEYTIVTAMSLFTEVLPGARATMMAGYLAAASLGRVAGALLGGLVWSAGGMGAIAPVSAVLSGLALASMGRGFKHWRK